MANLNSLFDVVRGWEGTDANQATFTEDFRPHSSVGANVPLVEGDIVFQMNDGKAARATGADLAGAGSIAALAALIAEHKNFWLVISGTGPTDWDGLIPTGVIGVNNAPTHVPWKITGVTGKYMFKTTTFIERAYVPGNKVTVIAGVPDITNGSFNTGFQPYAEVREYDSSRGVLTLFT